MLTHFLHTPSLKGSTDPCQLVPQLFLCGNGCLRRFIKSFEPEGNLTGDFPQGFCIAPSLYSEERLSLHWTSSLLCKDRKEFWCDILPLHCPDALNKLAVMKWTILLSQTISDESTASQQNKNYVVTWTCTLPAHGSILLFHLVFNVCVQLRQERIMTITMEVFKSNNINLQ